MGHAPSHFTHASSLPLRDANWKSQQVCKTLHDVCFLSLFILRRFLFRHGSGGTWPIHRFVEFSSDQRRFSALTSWPWSEDVPALISSYVDPLWCCFAKSILPPRCVENDLLCTSPQNLRSRCFFYSFFTSEWNASVIFGYWHSSSVNNLNRNLVVYISGKLTCDRKYKITPWQKR